MSHTRIDVHCHTVPPAYRVAMARPGTAAFVRVPNWTPEAMLDVMDRHGIAAVLPSVSVPGTHAGDDAAARDLSRRCNTFMAECAARWPGRFGGFAVLPLPDIDGACAEIEHALDVLHLDGVGLFTSYGDRHLGHPSLDPVLEALNARGAAVFVHPAAHPSAHQVGLNLPPFAIEYAFDTTRAAVSLILSGAMDRFPRINFILSHAGGTLPFLSWRVATLSERLLTQPALAETYSWPLLRGEYGPVTADAVMVRLRRFWFDIANAAGAQVIQSLDVVADPERVLFGSDWPYVPDAVVGDTVRSLAAATEGRDDLRRRIERGNAEALFPRFR
ncbi:amidohydrolase family protein [Roseomonas sp. BN140053]|uniref:amidohydrolase family protein n=1 Tax=Roseomonas sp. BN140053 TaxID=3391898 RepID=UPI0039EA0497